MQILLAYPRGFCAGVNRAINIVESAIEIYGTPIYVYHELVHNRHVIDYLREHGLIFVEKISEVPDGAILIFSAHGVSQTVRNSAKNRGLIILDATCPLVTKVHMAVLRASHRGNEVILIGHADHPEVEGTIGQYRNLKGGIYLVESLNDVQTLKVKDESRLSFVTQTTLAVDETSEIVHALRKRFPRIIGPYKNDICYATVNRQEAARCLAEKVDIVLVVGSQNSSNANRLVELINRVGKTAFLVEDETCIKEEWINKVKHIGITSGASVPDFVVERIINYLRKKEKGERCIVETLEVRKESIFFDIPKQLRIGLSYENSSLL